MFHHKTLLFAFCVAFSITGFAENQFGESVGFTLGIGQVRLKQFSSGIVPSLEIYSYYDDSKRTPQRVFGGVTQQDSSRGRYQGSTTIFYIGYDYALRVRLTRKVIPYFSGGLAYAYINDSNVFEVDSDGFTVSQPESKTSSGYLGYLNVRDNFGDYELNARVSFGAIRGFSIGIGRLF